jgi:hypothetical protein
MLVFSLFVYIIHQLGYSTCLASNILSWRVRLPSGAIKEVILRPGQTTVRHLRDELMSSGLLDHADEVLSNGVRLDLTSLQPLPNAASVMLSIHRKGGVRNFTGPKRSVPRSVLSRIIRKHGPITLANPIKKFSISPTLAPISAKVSKAGSVYAILGSKQLVNGSVEAYGFIAVELLPARTYGREDLVSPRLDKNMADVSYLAKLLNVSVLSCLVGGTNVDSISPVDLMIALKLGDVCSNDEMMVVR